MKRVEIEGREYVAAQTSTGVTCIGCVFETNPAPCPRDANRNQFCDGQDIVLTPENYVKLKLKGSVT